VASIFHDPKHPYTQALLRSIPKVGVEVGQKLYSIQGMVPDPLNRPGGCPFHNRCDQYMPGTCDRIVPSMVELGSGRQVRCLLYDDHHTTGSLASTLTRLPHVTTVAAPKETVTSNGSNGHQTLLEVQNLKMHFPVRRGLLRRIVGYVKAVDGINLEIRSGETLGLVGESGCGKTTTGRCIIRDYQPTDGQILYRANGHEPVDLAPLNDSQLKTYRRDIRMVFQDPYSSLDPRMPVLEIVGESLKVHNMARGQELEDRVAQLLRLVGLRPEYMRRYPHAFSGGERQRVGIARALALNPKLVICDEAVSALDVSVRAQILNLLQDLQSEFNLTYLFVAHDLSVVEYLCSRVAVMYVGQIVELAETTELYASPRHPYTEALLSAVPKPDPNLRDRSRRIVLEGDVPDPANPPPGCYFHPRCRYSDGQRCMHEMPALREISPNHFAACHYAETLSLRGVVGEG
jgi:peptide/nickel transport system ATP-binding protein